MISLINTITPIYLVFLLYGAAFLFLGVSIAAKDMKGSDLQLAGSLWMLSAFGFLHGGHEWAELGLLIEGEHLTLPQIFLIKEASTILVLLSFVFLLAFGISLVRVLGDKRIRWAKAIPAPLFFIFLLHVWYYGFHNEGAHIDMQSLRQANIAARYTFGFAGGLMAAYGLFANSREVLYLSRSVSKKLNIAAIAFLLYAVFAGIFFSWLPTIETPIVMVRGALAFIITYFITKALNIFNIELRLKYEQQTKSIIQAEKLTSLGRLAAGIAHEINNPLTSASLGIQTLKNKAIHNGVHAEIVERLTAVERNIDRASNIAAELLQFSRQKAAEFVLLDIRDAIRGALTLMRYRLKDVNIVQDLVPVPGIYGDPGKLEQVFINVLANAVEAMADGGRILIRTSAGNGCVLVRIADTGTGIEPENIIRAFDPFFTTKEVGKGTGLGLAISYGIIKQHGGSIEIGNAAEGGTVVSIKLPLGKRNEENIDRG